MVEVVEVEVEVVAEAEASAFRCTLPYALDEAKSGGSPSGVRPSTILRVLVYGFMA